MKYLTDIIDKSMDYIQTKDKYNVNDTGKSYSKCDLLQDTIGAETKKEFYCAYWENKDERD